MRKSYSSIIYDFFLFKKSIKIIQCKFSFRLKLCHSLNIVVRHLLSEIIARGRPCETEPHSSIYISLHFPSFRMVSPSSPSIFSPLFKSSQIIFWILRLHHHLLLFSCFDKLHHLEKAKIIFNSRQILT